MLIFALAFVSFYYGFYFSEGYRGVLGYENKDTLTFLQSYFNSAQAGSTLYWDPVYLQYTPRVPQSPISSPVTLFLVLLRRLNVFTGLRGLMPVYLAVLALIQVGCALAMFYFLRTAGLGFWPGVFGGLIYAYNHQTFAFGILHGYERITAVLLAPIFIAFFFRLLENPTRSPRRRFYTAATALLVGLALVGNGDIKPAAFFCIFLLIAALFYRPFSKSNLASLAIIFLLAAGIFAVQALPTVYSLPEQGRGEEPVEQMMDYSLSPVRLLLTHFWTGFTPRPDYPWENTAEFSMSMMPLVILGLFFLRRHRYRNIFLAALFFGWLWMMGKHLPTAPFQGWLMRLTALRHPNRMAMLVYFCYAFLGALGLERLLKGDLRPVPALALSSVPAVMLLLRLSGAEIPPRFIVFSALSGAVLAVVGFRLLPPRWALLVALFFILERTTVSRPPEEITVTDPTAYYTFDEIYRHHPRVEVILAEPDHRRWRAFFGAREYPDLFSHNLYLNAFIDDIRPIFAYFYIDEEFRRVREIQEVIFEDWSHPMWSLLNVRYLVDLEGYFALWDEEDTSLTGLDSLARMDEHVRINPRAEDELFIRYGSVEIQSDEWFLEELRAGRLDLERTVYLDGINQAIAFPEGVSPPALGEEIEILEREPDQIVARVKLPRPGVLVFSEFWFWPWRVEVDGESRPLRRAYHILQAVELEGGEHRVRFFFHSRHPAFTVPAAFSAGLAVVLGLYCLIFLLREKFRSGGKGKS